MVVVHVPGAGLIPWWFISLPVSQARMVGSEPYRIPLSELTRFRSLSRISLKLREGRGQLGLGD